MVLILPPSEDKRQEIISTAEKMGYVKSTIKENSKTLLVVFPSPEGPTRPIVSPAGISKEISFTLDEISSMDF